MTGEKRPVPIDLSLLDPDRTFPVRLAGDRDALSGLADGLWQLEEQASAVRLKQIARLAHRLAGAAGTFGHHNVSAAALFLEETILDRKPDNDPCRWHVYVRQAMDALAGVLEEALARTNQ